MEIAPRHLHAEAESDAWDAAQSMSDKAAARVCAIVNAGPFPGMSEAFDAHMGAACWTDPAYAPDASMWAAAWKASYRNAADGFRAQAARDEADTKFVAGEPQSSDAAVYDVFGKRWPA